jgi:hypothetical protein
MRTIFDENVNYDKKINLSIKKYETFNKNYDEKICKKIKVIWFYRIERTRIENIILKTLYYTLYESINNCEVEIIRWR